MAEKHTQEAEMSESRMTEHMRAVDSVVAKFFDKSRKGVEGFLGGLIFVLGTQACAPQLPTASATPDTLKDKPSTLTMESIQGDRSRENFIFAEKMTTPWGTMSVRGFEDILSDNPLKKPTVSTITFPLETKEQLGDRMVFVMGAKPRDEKITPPDNRMFVIRVPIKKEGDTFLAQQFSDLVYEKTPISIVVRIEAGYNPVIVVSPNKEAVDAVIKPDDEFEKNLELYSNPIPDGKNIIELAKEFKKDAVAFEVAFENKETKIIE